MQEVGVLLRACARERSREVSGDEERQLWRFGVHTSRPGTLRTSRARLVLVGVLLSLANGWHERVQEREVSAKDKAGAENAEENEAAIQLEIEAAVQHEVIEAANGEEIETRFNMRRLKQQMQRRLKQQFNMRRLNRWIESGGNRWM
ncbi:hypothetical protein QYE76_014542 [Lolium multiflorum]|uniref:Uncharacterized protein n=1 Tax=Lolium multiflorum TaxID=4521 RepID=A0AAD8U556_LOLMU|nr:hypothetical protein QYE76_014542 [Lolium multiflorum]